MLRILLIIFLFGTVTWFFYALRIGMDKFMQLLKNLTLSSMDSLKKLKNPRSLGSSDIINYLKVLAYFVVVVCALILTATGFIPYFLSGKPPTGYTLVLHVSIAPVFAVCMTLLTLLEAHRHVFNKMDRLRLNYMFNRNQSPESISVKKSAAKLSFWLLIFLTPVVIGSILLSMYPVFNTFGQETLLLLHLLSSLFFLIIGIFHTFLLINLALTGSKNEKT